ncbi:two-component sensor histidine kinase [Vibrio sp. vnigr-6D03]|uniref:histidine kinase sensor domain-containing protein n=1 Tax=Vibrio sp. vnigr-6D03 TaxID=2058088 RepID=UPI000C34AC2B|nr:histidine kinase sensor domain-containing protein [Vibrio sp. vnigr-6D03]PKF77504.1 two-component sensor histidine kinase [Vibrio sp. vnigr-6D03]
MKKVLFWRLFIILSLGVVIFFSLLHSVAILSEEKMSYIKQSHRDEILAWGSKAQDLVDENRLDELDLWLKELAVQEDTWATLVRSQLDVIGGNALNQRFFEGYGIGRNVDWKIHLYFPDNPIMEVALRQGNYHFLIILPDRMRPGTYMSHAFWLFRFVIPFMALLALTVYIYRYVMKPLQRFHNATQEFSRGNYQERIGNSEINSNDEFGEIAKTFDEMAERTSTVIEHHRNLISDMSHEIRTPISRIELALNCIERGIDVKGMFNRIETEVRNVRQLAEDTLTLAWIENERPDLRKETFDLTELVDSIIEDASFEYPNAKISASLPDHLVLSHSSQRALGQAIENVIRNGLRYTPEQGSFHVSAERMGNEVVLKIRDSGPGVPESMLSQIFKPFFKVKQKNNEGRSGFGVGLALAKRHIESVKGKIIAVNNATDGLEMIITLPHDA